MTRHCAEPNPRRGFTLLEFAFADGSVHVLFDPIRPETLGLLSQINDGQPTPAFA
jgi:hypothetical protein